jgi:hypothetical protein
LHIESRVLLVNLSDLIEILLELLTSLADKEINFLLRFLLDAFEESLLS